MAKLRSLVTKWSGNEDILNWIQYDGSFPLLMASAGGFVDAVQLLVNTPGVNVNKTRDTDGGTAIMRAAYNGHRNVVRILLAVPGIDLSKRVTDGFRKGKTALSLAMTRAGAGYEEWARMQDCAALLRSVGAPE